MEVLGLIGILAALVLFIFLVYKNCVSYWAVMICVAIVALTNRLNPLEALTVTFTGGLTDLFLQMFSIVFGGAILGKLFTDVGAANSIAAALIKQFLPEENTKNKVFLAVLVLFIFNGLCTMGGIDGYVGIFTMFPIYMLVCKKCDIPRRFLPGMMFLNCMFMAAPGAPQIHNVNGRSCHEFRCRCGFGRRRRSFFCQCHCRIDSGLDLRNPDCGHGIMVHAPGHPKGPGQRGAF